MIDKDLHDIENLFHAALDDNEEQPSAKVWVVVDNRLDKDRVVATEQKYKRLKRLSLLLLLVLLALSIYELVWAPRGHDHVSGTKGNQVQEPVPADQAKTNEQGSNRKVQDAGQNNPRNVSRDTIALMPPTTAAGINEAGRTQMDLVNKTVPPGQIAMDKMNFPVTEKDKMNFPVTEKPNRQPVVIAGMPTIRKENRVESLQESLGWLLSAPPERAITPALTMVQEPKQVQLPLHSSLPGNPSSAQAKRNKKSSASDFSLSAFFSRDVASYRLKENSPGNANSIRTTEEFDFSFTTGLLVDYPMTKRWAVQSGLNFSYTDIIIGPRTLYAQPDNTGAIKYRVDLSAGYGYIAPSFQPPPSVGDSLNVTAIAHKLQYLGMPVMLGYNLAKGKFSLQAVGGLGLNWLQKGIVETEIQQSPGNEVDIRTELLGLKPVYIYGQAGVGMRYAIHEKVSLQLAPTARFALTAINKGGMVKTYPNSLGVGMGVTIRF